MKAIMGLVMIIGGLVLGIYVGGYLCFIQGIIEIIQSINPLVASGIAWGIAKIVFASFFGFVSFAFLAVPGAVMLQD